MPVTYLESSVSVCFLLQEVPVMACVFRVENNRVFSWTDDLEPVSVYGQEFFKFNHGVSSPEQIAKLYNNHKSYSFLKLYHTYYIAI